MEMLTATSPQMEVLIRKHDEMKRPLKVINSWKKFNDSIEGQFNKSLIVHNADEVKIQLPYIF